MKRELLRRFSCSETALTLLDEAAGLGWKEVEEASDPLCGGILAALDAACGILWGAGLAAGVRAAKRCSSAAAAEESALTATQRMMKDFLGEEPHADCGDLTGLSTWSMRSFMAQGNLSRCGNAIAAWVPRFHRTIDAAIEECGRPGERPVHRNCACETMRAVSRAIGLDAEPYAVLTAGFAGGLGLSGNACGALAAAVFAQCLLYFRRRGKPKHSMIRSTLQGFQAWDSWMDPSRKVAMEFRGRFGAKSCRAVCGRGFSTAAELSDYLDAGGCAEVAGFLAESAARGARA